MMSFMMCIIVKSSVEGFCLFFCFGFWIAKQNDYVRSYIHNGKLIFCRLYVVINTPKKVEHMDNDLVTGLQSKVWQEIKNWIHLLKKSTPMHKPELSYIKNCQVIFSSFPTEFILQASHQIMVHMLSHFWHINHNI